MVYSIGRRVAVVCVFTIVFALGLISFFGGSRWDYLRNDPKQQLQGLIHVLHEHPEQQLPRLQHELTPLSPPTLGIQKSITPAMWTEDILLTEDKIPLVVFSKTYCPYSKRAKELLSRYKITPAPFIIEVDTRGDAMLIKAHLTKLTGRSTFPNVILRGTSLGGSDDLNALHASRKLKEILEKGGLTLHNEAP
ncbi:hypothetical protein FRC03_010530 [Tulasnella sp. 419]|nr:hypothetical protein FRC03_010530 [Tulasnella sp. 419]